MKCPVCNVDLKMADRQGIEIDYCPQCRGVWLDRGELDKIIERSAALSGQPQPGPAGYEQPPQYNQGYQPPQYEQGYQPRSPQPDYNRQPYQKGYPQHKRKREGFLGDLFDFD